MTRDEFESILEEAYIEGYNTALEDIQEDILDEEAFDLEGDYEYYTESSKNVRNQMRKLRDKNDDGATLYRNGTSTVSYRSDTPHPKAINKGLNWSMKTDTGNYDGYTVKKNYKNHNSYKSEPIGRIKAGEHDSDDPRSEKLKNHLEKNAEMVAGRELRKIAAKNLERANKPGLFKNKGNKYW